MLGSERCTALVPKLRVIMPRFQKQRPRIIARNATAPTAEAIIVVVEDESPLVDDPDPPIGPGVEAYDPDFR